MTHCYSWIVILVLSFSMSYISAQNANTTEMVDFNAATPLLSTTGIPNPTVNIDWCVGPLVRSSHKNILQESDDERFKECQLACESGFAVYGLDPDTQQRAVDTCTIIGTLACLIGLIILSVNLYADTKMSKEKFIQKPLLFHIPYMITLSTFSLTLLMSMSIIIGKENILCFEGEFSQWNPGHGESPGCTIFGVLFYYSLLGYETYTLLLSFVVWRQFKNPLNPLWGLSKGWFHGGVFLLITIAIIVALSTSAIDAIEPMGVCLPGPARSESLFAFVVFPMALSCVLSAIFLIWSAILVKVNINRHKKSVSRNVTKNMADLLTRILWYGFGVLFTLSLLTATGFTFWAKYDDVRAGLREWISCSLTNYFTPDEYGLDKDCDALRPRNHKISPFWFISWQIACLIAIIAQLVLSFHTKARERAKSLRQKTVNKIADVLESPKLSKSKSRSKSSRKDRMSKLKLDGSQVQNGSSYDHDSPRTTTTTGASSVVIPSELRDVNNKNDNDENNNGYPMTPPIHGNQHKQIPIIEMQEKPRSRSNEGLIRVVTPDSNNSNNDSYNNNNKSDNDENGPSPASKKVPAMEQITSLSSVTDKLND